ncbi:MAG: methyl-accepting chemotaxis protein [Oscillospiraceae bacterium]|jgi:methyl-accepting chemotaxis protein|nr:methyl-accepting chemotaxis protein [Oscillospiraceae bacterium]
MKNIKVRVKIVAPVIIAIILCAVAILVTVSLEFSNYVNEESALNLETDMRVLEKDFQTRFNTSQSAALLVAADNEIADYLIRDDHDGAVAVAQSAITQASVDFITIMKPDATILARGHSPDKFGDNLGELPSVISARQGKVTVGVETGNSMPLTIRAGAPIYDFDGNLVGLVNAGFDLSKPELVDSEKDLLDSEITIFIGDTRLNTTVIGADGNRAVGTQAAANISKQVLGGTPYVGKANVAGNDAIVHYSPLKGSDGNIIGMLFAGQYTASASKAITSFILLGVVVAVIIGLLVTILVVKTSKSITDPIAMMMSYLRQISQTGSLEFTQAEWTATRKEMVYKDEISQSLKAFVEMLEHFIYYGEYLKKAAELDLSENIRELSIRDTFGHGISEVVNGISVAMRDVKTSATQMREGITELSGASGSLAEDAQKQALSIDELTNSVNEIRIIAEENSDLAATTLQNVNQSDVLMQGCMEAMSKTVSAMHDINAGSESIRAVIKTIDDIAFQTNILALNAAVEAARAGQHGKGFAVVAEEVRSLASKSAEAARQTAELIEDNATKTAGGINIVQSVNEKLQEVVKISGQNAQDISKINEASIRQKTSVSQVSGEINEMQRLVQSNSATAQQVAAQGAVMRGNADGLQEIVARFIISEDDGPALLNA